MGRLLEAVEGIAALAGGLQDALRVHPGFCHWGFSLTAVHPPLPASATALFCFPLWLWSLSWARAAFIFSSLACGVAAGSRDIVLLRVPWRPFHTAVPFYETQMLWAGCVPLTETRCGKWREQLRLICGTAQCFLFVSLKYKQARPFYLSGPF